MTTGMSLNSTGHLCLHLEAAGAAASQGQRTTRGPEEGEAGRPRPLAKSSGPSAAPNLFVFSRRWVENTGVNTDEYRMSRGPL